MATGSPRFGIHRGIANHEKSPVENTRAELNVRMLFLLGGNSQYMSN